MSLTITPLDAPLGAEVAGFDFAAPAAPDATARLLAAVDEHLLLLFRNPEPPTPAQVTAFCESFGPLRPTLADKSRLPGFPGINRVSNVDVDGVVGTGGSDVVTYHSDLSFNPPLIEFLYLDAIALPTSGGATKWLNLVAAYQDLDTDTKARIDDIGVEYRLRDGLDFGSLLQGHRWRVAAGRPHLHLPGANQPPQRPPQRVAQHRPRLRCRRGGTYP